MLPGSGASWGAPAWDIGHLHGDGDVLRLGCDISPWAGDRMSGSHSWVGLWGAGDWHCCTLALLRTGVWGKMGSCARGRGVPRRDQAGTEKAVPALKALAAALMLATLTEPSIVWDLWMFVGNILAGNELEIC